MLVTDLGGSHPDILVFEGYRLDVPRAQFSRAGKSVPLRPRTFTLLCYLARNAGRVISKAELLAQVWPGVVVTDDSLSQCVGELRAALAERGPILIRTLPKRGYPGDLGADRNLTLARPSGRSSSRARPPDGLPTEGSLLACRRTRSPGHEPVLTTGCFRHHPGGHIKSSAIA